MKTINDVREFLSLLENALEAKKLYTDGQISEVAYEIACHHLLCNPIVNGGQVHEGNPSKIIEQVTNHLTK
jgi:hypothetical protein